MKFGRFKICMYLNILLCVLMFSCVEGSNETSTISFNSKDKLRSIFETGVIKSAKLVRLESDSCIVGKIDKIICTDSFLYILDSFITKGVYIFTREGRFVNKISRQGHSKFEYTQLWDMFFDKNKNTLCLLSRYDQKIISFTPDGKTVLEEIKMPKMFGHILPLANGYVGYMDNYSQNPNMPYNVWTMDASFNLLEGFVQIDSQLESSAYYDVNTLSSYGGAIYFKPEFVNTIYQIKDGKISECYKLDFGEKSFPELSSVSLDNKEMMFRLMKEKIANIFNYEETDDYLLMDFVMDGQACLGIYNKCNHTSEIASLNRYEDEYMFPFGKIKGMDESALYSVVNCEDVFEVWVGHNKYVNFEEKNPKQVNNIRKQFPHLKENGNPFIAIYSLK